jgi:hypothetical protein
VALIETDTVTLYMSAGEVDRKATYRRVVLPGVRTEERSGSVAAMHGRQSTDGLMLFVASLHGYVEPESYTGVATTWSIRPDDLIVAGACDLEIPPATVKQLESAKRVYRVTGIETMRDRRGLVHHLEVSAS